MKIFFTGRDRIEDGVTGADGAAKSERNVVSLAECRVRGGPIGRDPRPQSQPPAASARPSPFQTRRSYERRDPEPTEDVEKGPEPHWAHSRQPHEVPAHAAVPAFSDASPIATRFPSVTRFQPLLSRGEAVCWAELDRTPIGNNSMVNAIRRRTGRRFMHETPFRSRNRRGTRVGMRGACRPQGVRTVIRRISSHADEL
jgi:hypothetical protein